MLKLRTTARLSVTIGLLAGVMVWVAVQLNIVPSPTDFQRQHRVSITKSITAALGPILASGNLDKSPDLENRIKALAQTDPQIKCLIVRDRRNNIALTSDQNVSNFSEIKTAAHDITAVEIKSNDRLLGKIEVHFRSVQPQGAMSYFAFPHNLLMFTIGSVALITWLLFSRTLKYLNPSNIVPQRVRSALDTLTEGVVLVNQVGEVVHSNQAFQKIVGADDVTLIGNHIGDFDWSVYNNNCPAARTWLDCIANRSPLIGQQVSFSDQRGTYKFSVNASPIVNDSDVCRGAIISFDDITESEKKREQLSQTIQTIERQNEQLYFLASYDTLTECLNRGPFLQLLSKAWSEVEPTKLSLLMIDVDHFKSINDTHGHTVGDKVLKSIGHNVKQTVGERGSVCRYGGEEFIVLVPDLEIEKAVDIAHEIHRNIESNPIEGISVTASLGFSNRIFKAMDSQHLIDQADQCLYAAKHLGRNRVVCFDQCPEEITSETETHAKLNHDKIQTDIQYSAAMGLLSSLSFRCHKTANHSVRVAKLAVKIGESLLGESELYRLEMAALLHNIGKIGVPDSILYKPAPLDEEEWVVMRRHDQIGLQIVRSTFASVEIAHVLKCSQYRFSQSAATPDQKLFGKAIPIMSRIIYVCDVFDTMIHDRPYREGMPITEALKELVSCSPKQFDPEIIENLITHIEAYGYDLATEQSAVNLDPRSAAVIGGHIETIYDAIVGSQWASLLQTTVELREQASDVAATSLVDTIDELRNAMGQSQNDENIKALATDVIDLCRETRSALIDVSRISDKKPLTDIPQKPAVVD